MRIAHRVLAVATVVSSLACATTHPTPTDSTQKQPPQRVADPKILTLSQETATARAKQIGRVSYVLWFGLDEEREDYEARAVIHFDLKPKASEHGSKIAIDLEGGTVTSIFVNDIAVQDLGSTARFDGHHLFFKLSELHPLGNRIEIAYTHPYSHDGNGFHRFKDPVDQQVYLYTDFEPYHAHLMFPCFDQPDLKASYEVTVEAPEHWKVISNMPETGTSFVDGRKSWAFPPSPVFSTYLMALHAGPYAEWKGNANGIPIRLFARKSMAKYVDSPEWLEITRQGLDYFSVEFGYPYPFPKYDQILVPEFNAGAMENVGAVTFNENMIFRTKVTQDRHRARANTILHEMAHMWFGNLVTMRWWNGLWLNESFATFMASRAVDQATRFKGSWQSFFGRVKQWAYWEDQLVTTHPIEVPVPDTHTAEAIFDGITYGKGASTLKQLSFYLGEENFREGLQRYFQKFAFSNTTLADFIHMLEEASETRLTRWNKLWLQTSGVNTLQSLWKCDLDPSGKKVLSTLEILQTAIPASTEPNPLRPHRTQVALFYKHGKNPLKLGETFDVSYSTEKTAVPEAVGKPCPDFVYPNYGDQDYVKVQFSPSEVSQLADLMHFIADPFLRHMIWHSLWEMVVDGNLSSQDYADLVLKYGEHEKDTQILAEILGNLANSDASDASVLKYVDPSLRDPIHRKIETFLKEGLVTAGAGSDAQLIWFQKFLDAAFTPEAGQWLEKVLNGRAKLHGLPIDQERRWKLVAALARNGAPESAQRIQTELQRDATDTGKIRAIAAEALMPDPEVKKQWLKRVQLNTPEGESYTSSKLRVAMENYHVLGQESLTSATVEPFFETLPKLANSSKVEDKEYAKWFARMMFPSLCSTEIVQKTSVLLSSQSKMPAPVIKALKIARQEEERCIRARAKSVESQTVLSQSAESVRANQKSRSQI